MKPALLCLFFALPLGAATLNVRDFGATGDGQKPDTIAIQKALDACPADGTVEFPAGTYLCQPLRLHSNLRLQLAAGATLAAGTNQADFMKVPGDWLKAKSSGEFIPLISGRDLTNLVFTGGGTIDGQGRVWWGEAEKARQIKPGYTLPRPNLITLERCRNVRVENLTLQNSPKFHLVPLDCDDVVVSNVTILAPEHAANTDAIDPSGRHILITHCKLDVGDDNVAIKGGKNSLGRAFTSEDILVTDCVFLHGHGMSIGSETSGGVRNVTVRDCTFIGTENGLRIKSDARRGGIVENIRYENMVMSNVIPAITLTCFYQKNSAGDARVSPATNQPAPAGMAAMNIPVYRNIHFGNITATCPKAAGEIVGLPDSRIANVVLENVRITAAKSFEIRNATGIQLKNVSVTVSRGKPFLLENAEVTGLSQ